jgi:hypothetical protein
VRKLPILILLSFAALPAHAQVRRRVPMNVGEPSVWVSGGIGLFNGNGVNDGSTQSSWDFGNATTPQYRLSLEKAFSTNAAIGATGTYTHVPFTYRSIGDNGSCSECAAHLDMVTVGASFHYGGGLGFHQVLEGVAGIVDYVNLKRDDDKSSLAPAGGNIDPYFTFGYGFGYTLNPQTEVSVVQDFGIALHEKTGLTSEDSNTLRQRTLRLNFRYGFGSRIRTTRGTRRP